MSAQSRFAKCVASASKRAGVRSPGGVCATAGRKKYGAAAFARMAKAGRSRAGIAKKRGNAGKRRSNPVEAAAETYRAFHGHDPAEVFTFHTPMQEHSVLSGVGKLVRIVVRPEVRGMPKVILDNFGETLLAQNEHAKKQPQLYIEGGNQSVDLKKFGITLAHEYEVLGDAVDIVYHTVKTHLRPEDGGKADYRHKFGKRRVTIAGRDIHVKIKGSRYPKLTYDVRNKLLRLEGGTYTLPEVGISG